MPETVVVALKTAIAGAAGDDEALHRARKALKRARYAVEPATPLLGKKQAKKTIRRYKHVQEVLGEQQDSLVAAEFLRRLGAAAGTRPAENGFTYGLLFANEQQAATVARRRARILKLCPRICRAHRQSQIFRKAPAHRQ